MSKSPNEFSDRMVSSYNKYVLVSAMSIFASSFIIKPNSGFLGINFHDLPERDLETALFGATIILALNYFLRFWDEIRVITELDKTLIDANTRIKKEIDTLSENVTDLKNIIQDNEAVLKQANEFDSPFNKITRELEIFNKSKNNANKIESLLKSFNIERIFTIQDNYSNLSGKIRRNLSELERINKKNGPFENYNKLSLTTLVPKNFAIVAKLRIALIDILIPCVLLFAATYSFIYPNDDSLLIIFVDYFFSNPTVINEVIQK